MKKLTVLVTLLCILMTICVSARSGDIAGKYYSTDIVTTLNGVEIDAINIGGETLISAEDMYYYSFDVVWNAQERTLRVNSIKHAENGIPPAVKKSDLPSGSVLGYYYETDIVTYLDNKPITAYNIGGRTYIHAEEMRDFNYEVIWDAEKRSLAITSPDRWGYINNIPLTYGVYRDGYNDMGVGAFSIVYTKDGIIATDDANCFDMVLWYKDNEYVFTMNFYQNYRWSGLIGKLDAVTYHGMESEPRCEPSEKYDEVNALLNISINGHTAKKVAVTGGGGNGHVDFRITVSDLPRFKLSEIEEICISAGEVHGEPYEIVFPALEGKYDEIEEIVLKYPNDYIKYKYDCGDYCVVLMRESKQLGAVTDRMYVVNRNTGECSADVLEQVRALDGFNFETFQTYAYWIENNTYFRFSVSLKDRTADFSMKIDTAYVELLAESMKK